MKYLILHCLFALIGCHAKTPQQAEATIINVALWDTEICPLQTTRVEIAPVLDFSDDPPLNQIPAECHHLKNRFNRAIHGHYMLTTLINHLSDKTSKIRLIPYKVFSRQGHSAPHFWQRAINWSATHPVQLHIMGVGLPLTQQQWQESWSKQSLPSGIILAAAATFGAGIDKETILWPQYFKQQNANSESLWLLAGAEMDKLDRANMPPQAAAKGHFDPTILHPDTVQWAIQFSPDKANFAGNSWATARAAGFVLSNCLNSTQTSNFPMLMPLGNCLTRLPQIKINHINTSKNYPLLVFP